MADLRTATTLRPLTDEPGARFSVELDPDWRIATKPHGGYLVALCGRAAQAVVGPEHPHVSALSAQFLASPDLGTAVLEVEVLRRGRGTSVCQVRLSTEGRLAVVALVTLSLLSADDGAWWQAPEADVDTWALPPEEACQLLSGPGPGGFEIPFREVVEQRLDPAGLGFASGTPRGSGTIQGWLRLAGAAPDEPTDPLALLVMADALPPATFDLGTVGWVPTLELTVYVRALPAAGPLRVRQRAVTVTRDRVDEVCEVVDSRGVVVATGHQLAGVRLPEGPPPTT